MATRGFVTIATGNEKYYQMALRLLKSYRNHTSMDAPFAIICDRETPETVFFDQTVILENPAYSYLDKLSLYRYAPYDETIFIDADSLVLSDPSGLWKDFADGDDVSCYGCTYPLDSDRAWFTYDGCREYKKDIPFLIDLHGGIYYLRKGQRCTSIFQAAIALAENYSQYSFRTFENPADEPVLAMSLAIHNSRPCDKPMRVLFVPSYWGRLKASKSGELLVDRKKNNAQILHFGTKNTERYLYRCMAEIHAGDVFGEGTLSPVTRYKIWLTSAPTECRAILRHTAGQILRKILPPKAVDALRGTP